MALKGQAKTDYQREYMRKHRSNISEPLDPITDTPQSTISPTQEESSSRIPPVVQPIGYSKAQQIRRINGLKSKEKPISDK